MEAVSNLNLFQMIILFCCPLILVVIGSFQGCSSLLQYAKGVQTNTSNKKDKIKGILFIALAIYNITAYFIMIPYLIMLLTNHIPTPLSDILIKIFWFPFPLELLAVGIYGIKQLKNKMNKWSRRQKFLCTIGLTLSFIIVIWTTYLLFRFITLSL